MKMRTHNVTEIEALVKSLSEALTEAYAQTGNRYYLKASTEMGGVDALVWMAHNLSGVAFAA